MGWKLCKNTALSKAFGLPLKGCCVAILGVGTGTILYHEMQAKLELAVNNNSSAAAASLSASGICKIFE
jgi:hypothetical protein